MVDLNSTTPIDADAPEHRNWLERLQANILRGHGRDHARYVFARFRQDVSEAKRRNGLRTLAPRITSALKQREEQLAFRADPVNGGGGTVGNLLLSADGYRALGYPDAKIKASLPEVEVRWVKATFFAGMKGSNDDLKDPHVVDWQDEYQGRIDLLVILADDDIARLDAAVAGLEATLAAFAKVFLVEQGDALREAGTEEGYEHFGYLDGRSQPLFLRDHANSDGPTAAWQPVEPLSLVLVKDGAVDDPDAYGSFFVFRKLEQNVRDFVAQERKLARDLNLQAADRERAGALVIGRFRDGTPLVLGSAAGHAPNANDFRFDGGLTDRCPFHSHARKANPRGDIETRAGSSGREWERQHRIARRAIPYGVGNGRTSIASDPATLPTEGVGLLFGCFQSLIARQFGHIHKMWFNADSLAAGVGVDPLLGSQTQKPNFDWPVDWDLPPRSTQPFGEFVTLMGGEFFFAPSLTFLKNPPHP